MNVTSKGTIVGVRKIDPQEKKSANLSYRIQKVSQVPQQKADLSRFLENKWQMPRQTNTNFKYGLQNVKSEPMIESYKLDSLSSSNNDQLSLSNSRSQFNKKTSNQTYNASDKKQTKSSAIQSQSNILSQLNSRINVLSLPKQILEYLKIGDMQKFLVQYEKLEDNKNKIRQMKAFFKDQEDFYKKLKFIITDNNDSRDFYEDKSFNFFQEIPQLFNRILVEISKKLIKFEAFQQGNKPYLASNTSTKIEENFDKFFKAIYLITKDKQKDTEEKRQLSRNLRIKDQQIDGLKLKMKEMRIEQIQSRSNQNDQSRRVYLQTLQNNQKLKAKLRELERMVQEKQRNIIQLSSRMNISIEQNKTLKQNSKGLIDKIKKSQKLIQQLNDQIQTLKQQKPTKTVDILPISTRPLISQSELQNLRTQLQSKQKQILNFKRINYEQGLKQNDQIRYIRQLQEKLIQANSNKQQDQPKYYLQTSQILDYKDAIQKSRLVKMIGDYTKSQPIQFKLMYKHQPFIQPSFHNYVDNKSNFMILIKLVNDTIIGGFCPYSMAKSSYSKAGFLFNLTYNQLYPLKQGKPCFTYDEYYFTMGNAQIRIRMGDNFVYSSFGIQNQHFNSKGQTISKFLHGYEGQSISRQIQFKSFQIYEVKFDY